jgi:hypothetical protein
MSKKKKKIKIVIQHMTQEDLDKFRIKAYKLIVK